MSQTDRIAGLVGNSAIKVPCKSATTANITLSGEQTVDGVALVTGDRILVKNQSTGSENGIYVVDTGDWNLADDADGPYDWTEGSLIFVTDGSTTVGFWYLTTSGDIVPGTTSLTFAQASSVLAVFSAYTQTLLPLASAAAWVSALNALTNSMSTSRLLGRTTALTGAVEEITVGAGLTLAAGTLSASSTEKSNAGRILNGEWAWTVAASALTIALKTAAGADPSAGDPVTAYFTNEDGTVTTVNITAALSLTISNGSTLGTTNSTAFNVWAGLLNNAGTAEIWAVQTLSGKDVLNVRNGQKISTTAEGGAGGADSAQVFYSSSARSNVQSLVGSIGRWESGLATAGAWSAAPSIYQTWVPGMALPGDEVQNRFSEPTSVATGTTVMPVDDTIPQNTEGDQYMTLTATPKGAGNLLTFEASGHFMNGGTAQLTMAAFRDSTVNAFSSTQMQNGGTAEPTRMTIKTKLLAASTASTTFAIRAGGAGAGTTTFNGNGGTGRFNGTENSYIAMTEMQT